MSPSFTVTAGVLAVPSYIYSSSATITVKLEMSFCQWPYKVIDFDGVYWVLASVTLVPPLSLVYHPKNVYPDLASGVRAVIVGSEGVAYNV